MKKLYSTIILLAMMVAALGFAACGSGEDEHAIEDALQKEWDISNSNSAVGAVDCNVFSVKVDKVEGNTVYVSYSLKSEYASRTSCEYCPLKTSPPISQTPQRIT